MSAPATPPNKRSLALATVGALAVAALVLVLFILPAEYGIDPTGIGTAIGLNVLNAEGDTSDPSGETPENTTAPITIATYESSFPITSAQLLTEEGYLAEGDTTLLPFQVSQANVSKVTMRIEFHDGNTTPAGQGTRPDLFEIELKAPYGDVTGGVLVRSDPTSGGGIGQVEFVVRDPPIRRELEAANDAEALLAVQRHDPPDARAEGEWKARITMVDAGDADAAEGIPLGAGPVADTGDEWKITITLQTYSLDVSEKPGTRQRTDTVTLDIPAGGELEYKLAIALGKRVDYTWTTNGPSVYLDFHSEKTGDASGAFTRHKNGDFTTDAGTLIAPFDGRHGWFWRNTSGTAITITLEMRGQYEVIGRV